MTSGTRTGLISWSWSTDGETLSNKLAQGPLPLAQALQTGIEIADALDKAHRRGIVHRDLKPGNIMLTQSGAKLLDFGLAKLHSGGAGAELSAAPTMTSPLTGAGTVVGTFQYMAPEQLEGREADPRSDIFAFGAVLYEMVTGKRAFMGATQASVIASILKDTPPQPSTLQPQSTPILDGTITTCLAKSPDDRWQTAGDVGRQLKLIQANTEAGSVARGSVVREMAVSSIQRRWTRWAAVLSVFAVVAVALALAIPALRRAPAVPLPVRFTVITPASLAAASLAVSPDGRYIAYVAGSLFIRAIDAVEAQPIAGTENAQQPFWSPDSRHVAFAAQGQLKRIALAGGPPQNVAALGGGFGGGSWNAGGDILFSSGPGSPIKRVPASGGQPVEVTKSNALAHLRPSFLPDGRHFLFANVRSVLPGEQEIYVGSLDGGEPVQVLSGAARASYVPPGYLVFSRGAMLMAQSFDAARFSVSGEPVRIADGIAAGPGGLLAGFSISPSGVLAYAPGGPAGTSLSRLTWYGRDGQSTGTIGEPGNYTDVAISPDGRRIAVHLHEEQQGGNLWLWDASRGNFSQFTFDRSHNMVPIWAPDGRSILFTSNRGGNVFHLYRKIATGATAEEPILESKVSQIPEAWTSHHGGVVLFANGGPGLTDWTIWQLPLTGTPTATQVKPAKNTAEFLSEFSPDGRWIAYSTADVGSPGLGQVYVRSYPELNGPWRISSNGGNHPRWSPDGRELYS